MILVDTSVWIDFFNGKSNREVEILDGVLGYQGVAIGDLIMVELLQGFRSDKDYNTAKKYLLNLDLYNMLTPDLALLAAENYRKLWRKGVTVRKTADVIIATFCIENQIPLLYVDKDFIPFTQHLKLRSVC
ncbi:MULTISPECIES: type II toxin-antitoxin system VapC family toxin [Oceanospirillaceae]|uniref:PIN domain nuclease n=1 Tax=Oceanobacter antarcticus TaxID=3133425 RepID=A0ABW8NK06_9GAMM